MGSTLQDRRAVVANWMSIFCARVVTALISALLAGIAYLLVSDARRATRRDQAVPSAIARPVLGAQKDCL